MRAPRGNVLSCKGWHQEAALRMLMNNLDPEVAEKPEDLVVYGGRGKAARNWECFQAIVGHFARAGKRRNTLGAVGQAGGRFPNHTPVPSSLNRQFQPSARLGHLGKLLGA